MPSSIKKFQSFFISLICLFSSSTLIKHHSHNFLYQEFSLSQCNILLWNHFLVLAIKKKWKKECLKKKSAIKKELNAALLTIYRLQSSLSRCGQTMTLSIANMTHNGMRMGEINMDGRCGDFHCRAKKTIKIF